jgi:uncharacterized OB-fold protein
MKKCENCPKQALPKSRFCADCKKDLLRQMQEKGYLTNTLGYNKYRSQDMKENIQETKRGR